MCKKNKIAYLAYKYVSDHEVCVVWILELLLLKKKKNQIFEVENKAIQLRYVWNILLSV